MKAKRRRIIGAPVGRRCLPAGILAFPAAGARSSVDRVLASEARGRGFESRRARQPTSRISLLRGAILPLRCSPYKVAAAPPVNGGAIKVASTAVSLPNNARREIDRLLAAARRSVRDVRQANFHTERGVTLREVALGPDHGRTD